MPKSNYEGLEELKNNLDKIIEASKTISPDFFEIRNDYLDNILPQIIEIEQEIQQFPISVLNELRMAYDHLLRCFESNITDEEINHHLNKVMEHHKRCTYDCYKELCIIYDDKILAFKKDYRNYNLGLIDNGKFLDDLNSFWSDAKKLAKQAKILEKNYNHRRKDISIDNVYTAFRSAVNQYIKTINLFENAIKEGKLRWATLLWYRSKAFKIIASIASLIASGVIGWLFSFI